MLMGTMYRVCSHSFLPTNTNSTLGDHRKRFHEYLRGWQRGLLQSRGPEQAQEGSASRMVWTLGQRRR